MLHVCLRGQFPHFSVSRRNTTTTKILTYFSNAGDVPYLTGCGGSQNQQWTIKGDGTISTYDGRMCLDMKGGTGLFLQVWECTQDNRNQQWRGRDQGGISWWDYPICLRTTTRSRPQDGLQLETDLCITCVEASNVTFVSSLTPATQGQQQSKYVFVHHFSAVRD